MKPIKIADCFLYFVYLILCAYHFSLFFSLFFPGNSMSRFRLFFLLRFLPTPTKFLLICCIFLSFAAAAVITGLTFHLEQTLSPSRKKHFLLLLGADLFMFFLAISPIFFTYENSFLYNISDNEKIRFVIIHVCFISMLLFLLYYHFSLNGQKREEEHEKILSRMEEENRILEKQIDEDTALLSKWKKDIETYSKELSEIDGVPEDAVEYYNAIKNSFLILDYEETDIP